MRRKVTLVEEQQIAFDQLLASELHKIRETTTEKWIQENPGIDVSELNLSVECIPTPATISVRFKGV